MSQNSPSPKKPFKFEMWMLGALIVPIGIGLSIVNLLHKGTVDLGGSCSDSEECKDHAECLGLGASGSVCSRSCSTGTPCPGGFSCVSMTITMQNAAGFHELPNQQYCVAGSGTRSGGAHP